MSSVNNRMKHVVIQLVALAGLVFWAGGAAPGQRPASAPPAPSPAALASASGASSSLPTVSGPAIAKPRSEYTFPVGQTFVYGAVWRVFTAGTATLRMEQAGREHRVIGKADAMGSAAVLYHVRDRYEAFLDPATFCSRNSSRNIEEGLRRVDTNITFDYSHGKAVLEQKNLKKNTDKHEEHPIPNCVTDVLSAIYYVASLPLQVGSTYRFPLSDGGDPFTVNVHVEGKEQIKTPAGTFSTIRVQPETPNGLLKEKGKIWVWYSDDAARVPVQVRTHMYWGTLTFTLQRIDRN
jgi:Protein of unknown function (DUF3108)